MDIAIESLLQARLHFESQNYICAVILSGAAQRVLRDLCLNKKLMSTVEIIELDSGHSWKKVDKILTDCFNKTKHARMDSSESVSISSQEARVLMTVAASDLVKLYVNPSKDVADFYDFIRSIK